MPICSTVARCRASPQGRRFPCICLGFCGGLSQPTLQCLCRKKSGQCVGGVSVGTQEHPARVWPGRNGAWPGGAMSEYVGNFKGISKASARMTAVLMPSGFTTLKRHAVTQRFASVAGLDAGETLDVMHNLKPQKRGFFKSQPIRGECTT